MASPILTVAEMRSWEEATWRAGRQESVVIAQVGAMVARRAMELTSRGEFILALGGKGHNGDDVRQAVPHLVEREVELLNVSDPARPLPELVRALEKRPALIIDGLFGVGLNRPLDESWRSFITRVNLARARVLAVDAPSGLNCETGKPEGAAINATVTLTLGAIKRGLITATAAPCVGRLELASDIGLINCPLESDLLWTQADDFAGFPPERPMAAHKGDFGHLIIVAGSLGYHGAAVLAARGALAARPGLITVVTADEAYLPVAAQLQSAMVRPWAADFELPANATAVLFGPGLADPTVPTGLRKQVVQLWRSFSGAVVADASALEWIAGASAKASQPRVVTPHPGEAARMLRVSAAELRADRPGNLRKLSQNLGGTCVVLKGQHTLVGANDGPIYVNSTGNPRLAQGGSGDVLAGYLGGLLAQPALQRDVLRTIRYAVWRHGLAADRATWNGMIEELPGALAAEPPPAERRSPA